MSGKPKATTRAELVALVLDNGLSIHLPGVLGDYATMCGLDGDDSEAGILPGELPKGAFVDCGDCLRIWQAAHRAPPALFRAPRGKL